MRCTSVKELLKQGNQQILEGQYQKALETFQEIIGLEPQNFEAWCTLGLAQGWLDQDQNAIDSHTQALQIKPDYILALALRGVSYQSIGQAELAQQDFERAISVEPQNAEDWHDRSIALSKLKRDHDALEALDKAIGIDPENPRFWQFRGSILSYLKRDDEAIAAYDRALEICPRYLYCWYRLGIALYNSKDYEKAIVSFDKALEIEPDDLLYLNNWYWRGFTLEKLSRHEEAIVSYDRALEINYSDHNVWFQRAYALAKLARYEEAVSSFAKVIEISPNHYYAWLNKATCLRALNQHEAAIKSYDSAIKLSNDNYFPWVSRGNSLFNSQRYNEAIASYDQALKIQPDNYAAWLWRSSALAKLKEFDQALVSFDRAIKIEPENHLIWYNRGITLYLIGQLEEALNSFQQSLKLDSQFKMAWANQGHILTDLYRYEESLASYNRAIALDSEYADFHNGRGWALTGLGFYNDALAAYDQALQNDQQCWQAWRNRGWTIYRYRGLDEALKAWDEGLLKLKPEHPNYAMACAELHCAKGWAHDEQGKKQADCFSHWRKARNYYQRALRLLDGPNYRERYLDILKDLIKVLLGLGESDQANQLGRQGTALLQRLLSETVDPLKQQQLALKYASFEQLTVDYYVQSGQLVKALETAETGKNTCLSWLLSAHSGEANSLEQEQVGQLLNPSTAIVYWHLSPASITTFILTSDTEIPAILPEDDVETSQEKPEQLPQAYRQLLEFETWVTNWNQRYTDYGKAQDKTARENHRWRTKMSEQLERLKQILKIPTIVAQLPSSVSQIILIPHRDLHRFPLHVLFPDNFTLTYLPSLQMGLNLKGQTRGEGSISGLLSVEAPNNTTAKQHHLIDGLYAVAECQLIAQMFPTTTIQSDQATKEKVSDMLQQAYHGFHFSGHAAYNFNNPKTSALYLTGEDHLTVVDICGEIPLVKDNSLVCLSACETAVTGNQTITSEYVGLVSGCLRGGAHNVVSTLWTVQSISSFLLMVKFYSLLKDGTAAAIALGEAQRWLRDANYQTLIAFLKTLLATYTSLNGDTCSFLETEIYRFSKKPQDERPFAHPYHWTGFTLTGLPLQL